MDWNGILVGVVAGGSAATTATIVVWRTFRRAMSRLSADVTVQEATIAELEKAAPDLYRKNNNLADQLLTLKDEHGRRLDQHLRRLEALEQGRVRRERPDVAHLDCCTDAECSGYCAFGEPS